MLVYSKKIIQFIQKIKIFLKEVLSKEIGLKVSGDRFHDERQQFSYPIKVVIFNNRKMLGYFNSDFYELGFHECLMRSSEELLRNIIRHECAHYITCINHGNWIKPHGEHFKLFCQQMGWGEEVYQATTCLDNNASLPNEEESGVLRKVQKLMALSTSSNTHESEQAMIKSQQLLLKHNLDLRNIVEEDEEKFFLKRVMKQKKEDAKMRAIAQILETFFVNTIYNKQEGAIYLEIVGSATNVEIAEYVANNLQHQLDAMWNETKKRMPGLKGVVAKNSFFRGVAQGYCNKIKFLKNQYNHETSHALILIEKKLKDAKEMVYPRLIRSSSRARHCSQSSWLGEEAGRNLNIHSAVNNSSKNTEAYITFQNP